MPEISIILPCLNEEQALPYCLNEIEKTIKEYDLDVEIIVIDNGSTDASSAIIKDKMKSDKNVFLYYENNPGYGSAYIRGFQVASGTYIVMVDADGTYNFNDIPLFINKLRHGADLVVGNRFAEKLKKDIMPWHHQYIGNPFLSFLVKKLFKVKIHDIHCGMRTITKNAFNSIKPHTIGMEFASEVIIKAAIHKLKIEEVPTQYRKRIGTSKLRWLKDGLRHLYFIILFKIHSSKI